MKERLISNLGLKILSIFLAFFVWLVVVNVSNPEVTRSQEVLLEIENEQVLLAANRTYELSGKSTVTVSYGVRTRDEYKIRPGDFRAYVDLAELYEVTGSVPVKIEVLNNKELLTDVAAKPGVARIETEDLQRKRFDLNIATQGEPAEGYALNGIEIIPEYVYLEGPTSQIGQISYVGIEINIDGMTENVAGLEALRFYDSNKNRLNVSDRVHSDTVDIEYKVNINRVKNLSLDFEVSGAVASGYQYVGAECDVKSVSVTGLRTDLASLNKITIPASDLNLDGATGDKVVKVNLQSYLPEGVTLALADAGVIEVRLKVERLQTRTIQLSERDITKSGAFEGYQYALSPGQITVTLQGLKEDLDSLTAASLEAALNLSGLSTGSHKGVLTFPTSNAYRILSYSDFQVITAQKETGIGTGTEATEESTTGEVAESESVEETTQTKPTE